MADLKIGQRVSIQNAITPNCEGTIERFSQADDGETLVLVRITTAGAYEGMPASCYVDELLPVREVGR